MTDALKCKLEESCLPETGFDKAESSTKDEVKGFTNMTFFLNLLLEVTVFSFQILFLFIYRIIK